MMCLVASYFIWQFAFNAVINSTSISTITSVLVMTMHIFNMHYNKS